MHPALEKKIRAAGAAETDLASWGVYYPVVSSSLTARVRLRARGEDSPRQYLNFSTSNYLALGQRPEVASAVARAMEVYGLGANSSPALSGYYDVHETLEQELALFHGAEAAVLFPSGLSANAGTLAALLGKGDAVVMDEAGHGSLYLGAQTGGAEIRFYRHLDHQELDWLLGRFAEEGRTVLLAMIGVYSMTGEIENLPRAIEIARKHGAITFLDDAHAVGVLGQEARGSMEHFGLPSGAVDLHMSTLSKSLSGAGGYVAGPRAAVEFLRFQAKMLLLSASIPPPVAAGCLEGLRILRREGSGMARELRAKATYFAELLCKEGFQAPATGSAILAVRVPDEGKVIPVYRALLARGVLVNPILYPAVPRGEGRLRAAVTLAHSREDLETAARAFGECARECSLLRSLTGRT